MKNQSEHKDKYFDQMIDLANKFNLIQLPYVLIY